MIDLSFLTEAEQEAILKVLQRDSELKKAEEQRVRDLQENVNDENELRYKSGQWFYDAKSKRHRDKIHGADLVRASIRKRKKPATIERYSIMDAPDETEEDLMSSKDESNQSAKRVSVPFQDTNIKQNGTASPAKQRKNPFNTNDSVEEIEVDNEMPKQGADQVNEQEQQRSDLMSSIIKYGVKLPYPAPIGGTETSSETEDPLPEAEDPSSKQPPVPKPRNLVINGQPVSRSDSSLQREDSLNGTNKRRGILKRRSSSSSTDSESIRIPQSIEPIKLVSPASPILEAEQSPLLDDQVTSLENSPDRQKQVRFSEKVLQKPPTPNPESYNTREIDEFGILDPNSYKNELDYEFVDQESKPTQYSYFDADYDRSTEVLGHRSLEENVNISGTTQTPSNSAPILNAEQKLEDSSRRINESRVSEILDGSHPEISIDSAGTESLYAVVKKPSKSTSSDQEKDFDMDDALMEPKLLGQRGKSEPTYQSEQSLEFGKSYGGAGKINYGSHYTNSEPGKVNVSGEDILAPERTMNVQSSSLDFKDEPKLRTHDDYNVSKWRRPQTLENEDLSAEPQAGQAFPNVNFRADEDTFVKANPENETKSKFSPGEYNVNTQYKPIFLRNTPEVEAPSSNFPVGQNMPLSSTPENKAFQTKEAFNDDEGRELPTSAHFKVMSLKDRISDMPGEQMSNPSQFQSLKYFWNVEDKNRFKGDVDASPNRILTDVLKRNKATRADLKQRNSKEIPAEDCSLPSSYDSLSEEEQTSQRVASWLAQTSTVYGAEHVATNEDEGYPGEKFMENNDEKLVDRKKQAEDFSSTLQKQTEALEASKLTDTEHQKSKDIQISPFKEQKKSTTTILVNSTEKSPAARFYGRVVQISSAQSPEKETKIVADTPEMSSKQYPGEEVEESVERTAAPVKTASEYKIGLQKLLEEHDFTSTKPHEHQVEESNLPNEKQQLIETNEIVEKSSIPKGNDHQEFTSALNKLEIEASTPSVLEDLDEQPQKVSTPKTVSPVKPSFKIGFEHLIPSADDDTLELPQKSKVTSTVQSSPPCNEDMVKTTTVTSRKDEGDLANALKKLEHEASVNDASAELEDSSEKLKMTPALQSTSSTSSVQNVETPSFEEQSIPSPSYSVEKKSNLEDPYSNRTKKSTEAEDTYVIKAISEREKPKYTFEGQDKFPVEEQSIERTIGKNEESSANYRNQLMRLEEESAALVPGERTEESIGESVSLAPTKEVLSSNESMPTELPTSKGMPEHVSQLQPYAYKELAKYPQSPSDQSGSFTGSVGNVPCKKPDTSSEVSNSKQDQNKLNNQKEVPLAPTENSFPENAEKFKQMSQSVPSFLQDDTDGRETDSASESSFQIGRHKKSPSSLTNLSGSSGMASMSSVSGSVMSVYSGDFGNVDIKGSIEFAMDYVEQLKEFHIFIYQCKDLAAADVKRQRSDPYVKAYLLPEKAKMGKRKTAVKKKTLCPVYNEILRYKIPKQFLQSQTLNLSVWHHDALGRNSFLGEVNQNLVTWDWNNTHRNWYQLEARTPASGVGLENRGEIKLALKYMPVSAPEVGRKVNTTGEVHIWIKECIQLPMLRENKINSFVKCTILPDTSRKSRQKTRTVDKTPNPIFNHTMVYDGFKEDDLKEACVELTVWDHNKLTNHFLGGLRIGLGTGKSYGTNVDWMDSNHEESIMWEKMIAAPNTWIEGLLSLRMFKMAKLNK
ncbi:synaptotagmin-like protein 2 isoform X2 [Eleutherodactylus coqui]|uniref:synaptotagmin-like protein 2 isoform X2 n=1 Tax=Eleutherodactylus coqui TaxID=57060 RepID=UPI003461950D